MIYSYQFTLCRRAVLVTMDLSAKNLHMLLTDHWLSNPKNVLVLRLDAPAWATADVDVTAPRRAMTTWTVEEVATWMESQYMAGPAAFFRTQGVNGKDLLSFETAQQLSRELKDCLEDAGVTENVALWLIGKNMTKLRRRIEERNEAKGI